LSVSLGTTARPVRPSIPSSSSFMSQPLRPDRRSPPRRPPRCPCGPSSTAHGPSGSPVVRAATRTQSMPGPGVVPPPPCRNPGPLASNQSVGVAGHSMAPWWPKGQSAPKPDVGEAGDVPYGLLGHQFSKNCQPSGPRSRTMRCSRQERFDGTDPSNLQRLWRRRTPFA
jgi:hypothetical protein